MLYEITLQSNATYGTDKFYVFTDSGEKLAQFAEEQAQDYGATVYEIREIKGTIPKAAEPIFLN